MGEFRFSKSFEVMIMQSHVKNSRISFDIIFFFKTVQILVYFYRNLAGAVQLNVKVGDDRRRVGDACVTFLLSLFCRRRIGDVRRLAVQICVADQRRRSESPICGADQRRRSAAPRH